MFAEAVLGPVLLLAAQISIPLGKPPVHVAPPIAPIETAGPLWADACRDSDAWDRPAPPVRGRGPSPPAANGPGGSWRSSHGEGATDDNGWSQPSSARCAWIGRVLPFRQVDVFSAEPWLGNPLAVVHDADGVDDETWEHHLKQGDYSRWLREQVKDTELADDVAEIEATKSTPKDTRAAIRAAVEKRYTMPAEEASGA